MSTSIYRICGLAALVTVFAAPAAAHHSLAASYHLDRRVSVEGLLARIDLGGPHSHILIDVKGRDGRVVQWRAEWVDARALACAHVDPKALKAGDTIRITGAPSREPGKPEVLVETLTRPIDGWTATGLKDTWNDPDTKCSLPMPAWGGRHPEVNRNCESPGAHERDFDRPLRARRALSG
ncbi:MAG TPA: DUF6152 family protein [Terriglobia bacterium]|nr:DUF6152 family protein [Terriglobia bacterium]